MYRDTGNREMPGIRREGPSQDALKDTTGGIPRHGHLLSRTGLLMNLDYVDFKVVQALTDKLLMSMKRMQELFLSRYLLNYGIRFQTLESPRHSS